MAVQDGVMSRYLHGHSGSVVDSHAARSAENSCGYLLPHLEQGMRILDVGCGPATITLDLAGHVGPGGEVVGVEPLEETLDLARAEAARRGDGRTRFETADVSALPYAEATFDVAHAHQVLQHLPDPVGALREMARVTRPGGYVAVRDADYEEMSWYPRLPGMERWRELYLAVARANDATPDAARHMRRWAREAGLGTPALTTSTWTYADEESCAWWGNVWRRRALESRFADEVQDRGLADRAELAEISADWERWGSDPDAWFVMVHGELLARPAHGSHRAMERVTGIEPA
ncbi:MAG: methyltransferase domain-containing protein [Actinomycetaceae bacterium]